MGSELLEKEEKYHKLNAELEVKTNELVKEVEHIMKVQSELAHLPSSFDCSSDIYDCPRSFDDSTPSCSAYPTRETKKLSPRPGFRSNAHYPLHQTTHKVKGVSSENSRFKPQDTTTSRCADSQGKFKMDLGGRTKHGGFGDDLLPETAKDIGAEALIRLYRGKGKLLQEECESLQKQCRKQSEEIRRMNTELGIFEEDKKRWQQQVNNHKEQINKLEQTLSTAHKKLQDRESENVALRKEFECLKREVKQATQSYGSNEIRLNRALEEVEKLKSALKQAKLEEKELRESSRKKNDELTTTIKRLEKQKLELVAAFKKQLQLIDNLKKQKAHLEAGRVIQFTEEEFMKLLEWNPDKT